MKDEALAKHFGFSDGMRRYTGNDPVYLDAPVCLKFPDAYNTGAYEGFCYAEPKPPPAPPVPFILKPFVALWDKLFK